jgi:hypothetical protein
LPNVPFIRRLLAWLDARSAATTASDFDACRTDGFALLCRSAKLVPLLAMMKSANTIWIDGGPTV